MGHIFLGHGGLNPSDVQKVAGFETVAVPPGTTLQFYSDFGQELYLTKDNVSIWSQLQAPWEPLDDDNVTYNLTLSEMTGGLETVRSHVLSNISWANGNEVHTPGLDGLPNRIMLCTGHADCPTNPEHKKPHKCQGILAKYPGQDLYWIACTAYVGRDPEATGAVVAARSNAPATVVLGQDPDDPVANARAYLLDASGDDLFQSGLRSKINWFFSELPAEDREALLGDAAIAEWSGSAPVKQMLDQRRSELQFVEEAFARISRGDADSITWYAGLEDSQRRMLRRDLRTAEWTKLADRMLALTQDTNAEESSTDQANYLPMNTGQGPDPEAGAREGDPVFGVADRELPPATNVYGSAESDIENPRGWMTEADDPADQEWYENVEEHGEEEEEEIVITGLDELNAAMENLNEYEDDEVDL